MLFIQNEDLAYVLCFAMQTLNAHSRALLMQRLAGADPARYVNNNISQFFVNRFIFFTVFNFAA